MDNNTGPAPLSVRFTDLSENAVSWSWDFESDGNSDSTDKNPVYVFTTPGTYTITLSITNENGAASKIELVTVTQPVENDSANDVTIAVNNTVGNTGENTPENTITEVSSGNNAAEDSGTGDDGTDYSQTEDSEDGDSGSSHSSSGGSGGAGVSPEPARNVETKEISQTFIADNKEAKFNLKNNATCVAYLTFDSKKTVGKTTAIIEMLKDKSMLTPDVPEGEVYIYFNIWVGTGGYATSNNIENPIICFKVEKTWMEDKNINKTSIALNRYNAGKWGQLPVSLSEEDDRFLYFTAQTPEFSFFAITGKSEAEETPVAGSDLNLHPGSEATDLNGKNTGAINSSNIEYAFEKKVSAPGFETIYGVISLLALFLFKKVKPGN